MSKTKYILLFVAILGLQFSLQAQGNSTNSPYSRYGYGILEDQSSAAGHAMGGLGYGLRKSNMINPMNPASYSAVDSLTFLFDMGADFQIVKMKEGVNKQKDFNGNIKNINLLFPLGKGFAFSAGFLPVTSVGYEYGEIQSYGQNSYSGSGGFTEVYGGVAYKYRSFSLGVNLGYLFGDIEHYTYTQTAASYNPYRDSIIIRSHDFAYNFGVQQIFSLENNKKLILGASYSPKLKMTAKGTESQWIGGQQIRKSVTSDNEFDMAQKIGVGASLSDEKLLVGADFLWENWADAKMNGVTDTLNNRIRVSAGAEFTPNARNRNFFNRVNYRIGGYYSNSYITTEAGGKYNEFGISVGLGLPIYNKSVLHLSFDYVNVNPTISGGLTENYFKITLNYTFNETWFRKWKLH